MKKFEVVSRLTPIKKVSRNKKEKQLENPIEKKKKLPTFEEKYEDSLIKQLFEEKIKELQNKEKDEEESDYFEENHKLHTKNKNGEWDVPVSEKIEYFDPELSYELTGYRPITMEQGLDFDPTPFTETARIYQKNDKYTEYPPGCKPYADFWNEQLRRCVEGYTVGKYRVTGDHYFFLNFYRMQTINENTDKATTGRNQGFPSFAAKQYEFFHYLEMCEYIGKDVLMLKARAMGFSEILACIGVRPFITTRYFRTVYTAAAEPQVGPVLDKCWVQLNWLNMNTQGGMKRSRQKIDNIRQKRASLLTPDGTEFGRK